MIAALLLLTAAGDGFADVGRPFLEAHCLRCHGGADVQGGLDLSGATASSLLAEPDEWDWLAERVELGEMPPAGEAAPDEAERASIRAWVLENVFGTVDEQAEQMAGHLATG